MEESPQNIHTTCGCCFADLKHDGAEGRKETEIRIENVMII